MDRRKFLLGSAFTAAAFSEPALFALTVPPAESTAHVGGKRVGMADVEIITENIAHLRRLDHHYGSGRVRDMSAGDRPYAANVLSHMSRLTVQIGHGALTDHDRLQHARQAVALARAGQNVTQGRATPRLSALLLGFYTEAELAADLGRCLRDVGDPEPASRIQHAMDTYEPWRVRSRCFVQTDLATAHPASCKYEQAAAVGRDAVRTAGQVSSVRTLDRLRTLHRQVKPLRGGSHHLRELDDRIVGLLSRNSYQNGDCGA